MLTAKSTKALISNEQDNLMRYKEVNKRMKRPVFDLEKVELRLKYLKTHLKTFA